MRSRLAVLSGLAVAAMISAALVSGIAATPSEAANGADFNPGNIISDASFFDGNAMSQSQIQSFIETMEPGQCGANSCLKQFRTDTTNKAQYFSDSSGQVECTAYAGAANELASTIIFRVQQTCGVSAKVLLVTMQKEEGLVTNTVPSASNFTIAMGYGCPDTADCDTNYYGFFNQVYDAARQFKAYKAAASQFNFRAGRTSDIQFSPNASCGTISVYIQNNATAALYNYTPYVPNAAALANPYGTGDGCSSYGNRNFFVYYTDWFGADSAPKPGSPSAPQSLIDTANSYDALTLSWLPPASSGTSPVTGYAISYRSIYTPQWQTVDSGVVATSYTFVGSTPGVTFDFMVQPKNATGFGTPARVSVATPAEGSPGAPSGLSVTSNTYDALTLVWSAPSVAGTSPVSSYTIEYRSIYSPQWQTAGSVAANTPTFTSVGATPGLTFTLRVRAVDDAGPGATSYVDVTTPQPAAPGAPGSIAVTSNTFQALTLTWQPPADSGSAAVTDYVISYRSVYTPNWQTVADGVSTATSYTFVGSTPGVTFTIRVQAKNAVGVGSGAQVDVTTPPPSPPVAPGSPGAPGSMAVTSNTFQALTLTWQPPADSGSAAVTDYVISYRSVYTPNWQTVADGVSTATSYTFVGSTPGVTFTIRVQAKNSVGAGAPSYVDVTTPPAVPPGAPGSIAVTSNTFQALTLTWQPPADSGSAAVTDYVISYRSVYTPNWQTVADGVSTATSYTFVGSTPGVTFTIRVQAKNAVGVGSGAQLDVTTPPR